LQLPMAAAAAKKKDAPAADGKKLDLAAKLPDVKKLGRPIPVKLVVVGDGAVGKTCLVIAYTTNTFAANVLPTVFDNYTFDTLVDGKFTRIGIWDTAGQADFDRLRPLSFRDTDVYLICFSVANPLSLQNVAEKWALEVKHYGPTVPIVLCATQVDLRDDDKTIATLKANGLKPVTAEAGQKMKDKIGAKAYIECSALTFEHVKTVFDESVRAAFIHTESLKPKPKCIIL